MDEGLEKRVRTAAAAAWWTLLAGAIWLTASWLIWLWLLHARPGWMLVLWGGGELSWDYVQRLTLTFFAVAKLMLLAVLLAALWLSVWACRLKRTAE